MLIPCLVCWVALSVSGGVVISSHDLADSSWGILLFCCVFFSPQTSPSSVSSRLFAVFQTMSSLRLFVRRGLSSKQTRNQDRRNERRLLSFREENVDSRKAAIGQEENTKVFLFWMFEKGLFDEPKEEWKLFVFRLIGGWEEGEEQF